MALCHSDSDSSQPQPKRDRASASRLHACAPLLVIAALLAVCSPSPALSSWPAFRLLSVSAACSPVPPAQWVKLICKGTTDATFVQCTKTASSGHFVAGLCIPGDPAVRAGNNTQTAACSSVRDGEFVSRVCDGGSYVRLGTDTEKKNCTAVPSVGSFVSRSCLTGGWNTLGNDTNQSRCTLPTPSQFIRKACIPGSWAAFGYDSVIDETRRPAASESPFRSNRRCDSHSPATR